MSQVLKVRLYATTGMYRNPVTMEVIETYPLPPPSTIIGFIKRLIESEELPEIDFSIQGKYGGIATDYQWFIKKEIKNTRKPIISSILTDLNLIIHIKGKKEILEQIKKIIENPTIYPSLGRAEDLVKIESVKFINIEEKTIIEKTLNNSCYINQSSIPEKLKKNINGISYKLPTNFKFKTVKIKKNEYLFRDFEWEKYLFVEWGGEIEYTKVIEDKEGDLIWWCLQNQNPKKTY